MLQLHLDFDIVSQTRKSLIK